MVKNELPKISTFNSLHIPIEEQKSYLSYQVSNLSKSKKLDMSVKNKGSLDKQFEVHNGKTIANQTNILEQNNNNMSANN